MFYLFIFESIGTSELMLIGLIALIVFGPRKLPEIARTIGKTMNEFRRSTDDFKKTWQQEIDLEGIKKDTALLTDLSVDDAPQTELTISKNSSAVEIETVQPSIKQIDKDVFDKLVAEGKIKTADTPETAAANIEKRDWL